MLDVADGLELFVFGDEVAIANDWAELVFGDSFRDLALHAAVKGGPELIFLKVGSLGGRVLRSH